MHPRCWRRRNYHLLLTLSLLGSDLLACRGDTTGPALTDAAHLYYRLRLNHHAITLALTAPYDTLRLIATAQSGSGGPIVDTSSTRYTVLNSDTNIVVDQQGLIRAVAPDFGVMVVATRTVGHVTHIDTAIVNVNNVSSIPSFTRVHFDPEPGDSAKATIGGQNGFPLLYVNAIDAQGDSIPNVQFRVTSSDPNLVFYLTGGFGPYLTPDRPGVFLVFAEATIYGVSRVDTIQYTVGWPIASTVNVYPVTPVGRITPLGNFSPHDDTVAVGATVVWVNNLQRQPIDITFDTPSGVNAADSAQFASGYFGASYVVPNDGGGNIAQFTPVVVTTIDTSRAEDGTIISVDTTTAIHNNARARQFLHTGAYPYHSVLYGTTGLIHVLPESQVPVVAK